MYLQLRDVRLASRRLLADRRMLPDFLIIGAQKAGTTSLFNYVAHQPAVLPPLRKEVHYFDKAYDRGEAWYRAFFPLRPRTDGETAFQTGEASPYYLFHPAIPERAHALIPQARLVVLLRDPVERAFSQYRHSMRKGFERGSFEAAIEDEFRMGEQEEDRLRAEPYYQSKFHQQRAYVARGYYLRQIQRWLQHYPRERLLVVQSESLFRDPEPEYRRVLDFLGIEPRGMPPFEAHNQHGRTTSLNPETRERLREHYAPHNRALFDWLGEELDW